MNKRKLEEKVFIAIENTNQQQQKEIPSEKKVKPTETPVPSPAFSYDQVVIPVNDEQQQQPSSWASSNEWEEKQKQELEALETQVFDLTGAHAVIELHEKTAVYDLSGSFMCVHPTRNVSEAKVHVVVVMSASVQVQFQDSNSTARLLKLSHLARESKAMFSKIAFCRRKAREQVVMTLKKKLLKDLVESLSAIIVF